MPSVNCDPAVTASVAMVTGLSLLTDEGLRHPVEEATSRSASRPRLKVRGGLCKLHQPPVQLQQVRTVSCPTNSPLVSFPINCGPSPA